MKKLLFITILLSSSVCLSQKLVMLHSGGLSLEGGYDISKALNQRISISSVINLKKIHRYQDQYWDPKQGIKLALGTEFTYSFPDVHIGPKLIIKAYRYGSGKWGPVETTRVPYYMDIKYLFSTKSNNHLFESKIGVFVLNLNTIPKNKAEGRYSTHGKNIKSKLFLEIGYTNSIFNKEKLMNQLSIGLKYKYNLY